MTFEELAGELNKIKDTHEIVYINATKEEKEKNKT